MSTLKQYSWEVTHITTLATAVTIVALVTHLTGTPRPESPPVGTTIATTPKPAWHPFVPTIPTTPTTPISPINPTHPAHPAQAPLRHRPARSQPSNPREITVGAPSISNRYTLVGVDRKPASPTSDDLTVRLRVESLAMQPLVSPFGSDMLELHSRDLDPISPIKSFNHPIPSGNTLNQDIVFRIPTRLSLNQTTLQIRYYNYQNEIPLNLPPDYGAQ